MVAYIINVYQDAPLAERLAEQVRRCCPEAQLIFIGDGVKLPEALKAYGITRTYPRLKHKQTGAWTQRYLMVGLGTGADTLIKLDPDTCMWRRPEIPSGDWFGSVVVAGFVKGGAFGLSRAAARRVVSSGLLRRSYPYRYGPHQMCSQDQIFAVVAAKLKIKPKQWSDIHICGSYSPSPEPEGFALTHPHPKISLPKWTRSPKAKRATRR